MARAPTRGSPCPARGRPMRASSFGGHWCAAGGLGTRGNCLCRVRVYPASHPGDIRIHTHGGLRGRLHLFAAGGGGLGMTRSAAPHVRVQLRLVGGCQLSGARVAARLSGVHTRSRCGAQTRAQPGHLRSLDVMVLLLEPLSACDNRFRGEFQAPFLLPQPTGWS